MRRAVSVSGVRFVALVLLAACGGPPDTVLNQGGPRGPRFVLRGDCAPSTRATVTITDASTLHCTESSLSPTLFESDAAWTAQFGDRCPHGVDLSQARFVLVPARGAQEWFVFPNFVAQRDDAIELGLVIRPQGALPPDTVVRLPRDGRPIELRWCRSVCVENCDVAIP